MRTHVVLLAGLLGLACYPDEPDPMPSPDPWFVVAPTELRLAFREDWADHAAWTRGAVVAVMADLPDAEVARTRLTGVERELVADLARLYGWRGMTEVQDALHRQGVLVLTAAKVLREPNADLGGLPKEWAANLDRLARAIVALDPRTFEFGEARAYVGAYFDDFMEQAYARATRRFANDVAAWDAARADANLFADHLAAAVAHH
jgi:hypothetical protein